MQASAWFSSLGCDNLSTLIFRCLFPLERAPHIPIYSLLIPSQKSKNLSKLWFSLSYVSLQNLRTWTFHVCSCPGQDWPPSSRLAAQAFPAFQARSNEPFSIPRLKPLHQLRIAMLSLQQKVVINLLVSYMLKIL